jgi:hypothetical protein
MVNKKGWIRVVEATAAILVVFSIMLILNKSPSSSQSTDLTIMITPLLEEIAHNTSLRESIVTNGAESEPEVLDFVASRIRIGSIKYSVVVCDIGDICSLKEYPKDVEEIYAGERVISSTITQTQYHPRKVKIFLWRTLA